MPNLSFDFSGLNAVVTGGTRGIGRAVSLAFHRAGARVCALFAGNEAAAASLIEEAGGARMSVHKVDVCSYADAEAFFAWMDNEGLPPHILVNNAGIRRDAVVAMMPEDAWRAVIDTNLTGAFHMAKLAVMRMSGLRFGRVVFVTSPSARLGFPGQANYAASKAGLVSMARSLAAEVARRGITANCVSPGFVDTDLLADLSGEAKAKYKALVPANRFGTPVEVADAVLFLASREAAYINGTVLEVAGGL